MVVGVSFGSGRALRGLIGLGWDSVRVMWLFVTLFLAFCVNGICCGVELSLVTVMVVVGW